MYDGQAIGPHYLISWRGAAEFLVANAEAQACLLLLFSRTHWTLTGHPLDTHSTLTGHPLDTHWKPSPDTRSLLFSRTFDHFACT